MGSASIKKNTVYNIIKTASTILFPIITFPYISRVLQPDNIGKINFGNSIVGYISLLATLGVTTYAIRECSKVKNDREELGKLSGEILSINLFTTVIAYLVLAVLLLLYGKLRDYRLLIMIQSMSVLFATLGADWLNTAMEDFKYITIRTVAFQVLSVILMFIFVREPNDYINYAVITVLSSSGGNIMNMVYRRKYCKTKFTLKCNFKKHLPPILGLFAMLLAQQIFTMCDTTIIGLTLGDYQVGLYSAAIKIYNVINQIACSIFVVTLPQLSIAFAQNHSEDYKRILNYFLDFSVIVCLPCVIGMFTLSQEIIILAGGSGYLDAEGCLKILSVTLIAGSASNCTFNANLLASGKDKICLLICVTASVVNLVSNIIFIPLFGIEAAACTTLASQILITIISIPFIKKDAFSAKSFVSLAQSSVACLGLLFVIICVKAIVKNELLRLLCSAAIGGCVYFALLIAQKNRFIMQMLNNIRAKIKAINKREE